MSSVPSAANRLLVGAGRDADVFALDDGRVLRRYRSQDVRPGEVLAMAAAARGGVPVPRVYSFRGREMVMERLEGITMQAALERADPARVRELAHILADLHRRLHRIKAPTNLDAPYGSDGNALLHLDLHPGNVLLTERGPFIIDWANAARGPAGADVALSLVIFESAEVPPEAEAARQAFIAAFREGFDPAEIEPYRAPAIRQRLADSHLHEAERTALLRMQQLVE